MSPRRPLTGVVLLDKPLGLSSNAALQRVRRLYEAEKAGHSGSLDPLASGMLPICLGEATKLAGELLGHAKAYEFTLRLGQRTSTGDAEGQVTEEGPLPALSAEQVEAALVGLRGAQQQVPPMYSALKRDGTPLYRLARQGIEVAREARPIEVQSLVLCEARVPELRLVLTCSSGTYVRTLGEALAQALGTVGHLVALRRTWVAPFEGQAMWSLEALAEQGARARALLPADAAVPDLPALHLGEAAAAALRYGQAVEGSGAPPDASGIRLYDAQGCFFGLGQSDAQGRLRVRRLFATAAQAP